MTKVFFKPRILKCADCGKNYTLPEGIRSEFCKPCRKNRPGRKQLSVYMRTKIFMKSNYNCVYCGLPATVIDHVIPVCHGGRNGENNLVAACHRCNSHLSGRLFKDFEEKYWWMRLEILDKIL